MKTLIYDNECPLCAVYTGAFVKTGLLEKEGRKNFNEVDKDLLSSIDAGRMHNEIPLIENETGKVWYGIDALLEILGARLPFIKKAGQLPPVNWLLKKLYKLVSYNRKVIVAVHDKGYDCSPDFNPSYRILFLFTGLTFNSWLFTLFIPVFVSNIFLSASFYSLQVAHFSLVAVNICIAIVLGKKRGLEYLGQVNMLAIITLLLLLPYLWLQPFFSMPTSSFYLGAIFYCIATEYIRRMKYAGISGYKPVIFINIICLCALLFYLGF